MLSEEENQVQEGQAEEEVFGPPISRFTREDLHRLTHRRVNKLIDERPSRSRKIRKINQLLRKQGAEGITSDEKFASFSGMRESEELRNDVYNMLMTPASELEISIPDDEWHRSKYEFLMRFNNPYYRQVTQNSEAHSFLGTTEILFKLEEKFAEKMLEEYQDQLDQMKENQKKFEEMSQEELDQMEKIEIDFDDLPDILKQAMEDMDSDDVQEALSDMDDSFDELDQARELGLDDEVKESSDEKGDDEEDSSEDSDNSSKESGDQRSPIQRSMDAVENLELIGNVDLRESAVQDFMKRSFKHSKAYFAKRYEKHLDSILDTDTIDEIVNMEDMHPEMEGTGIQELLTERKEHKLSFNVFIDCSGSMSSSMKLGSSSVDALTLAELTAVKIMNMGYVNEIRFFNQDMSEPTDDKIKVITTENNGGTNIEMVLQYIKKHGEPTIIITDMCDNYRTYTPDAFFIGINGADMGSGEESVRDKYLSEGQFLYFSEEDQRFYKGKP